MVSKPRIYLFHGNDAWSSSRALQRWVGLFREKYGEATRYSMEADEIPADALISRLSESLMGDALFLEPKLVVVRRIVASEKPPSTSLSKEVVKTVEKYRHSLDEKVTLVIWEDRHLPEKHPLLVSIKAWEEEGAAKVQEYDAPTTRVFAGWADRWCQEWGTPLKPEARTWITEAYSGTEIAMRTAARLKVGEKLASDERVGWMYNALQAASLEHPGGELSKKDLASNLTGLYEAAAPFILIDAAQAGNWPEAYSELRRFTDAQDSESGYYGFMAAMRWAIRQRIRPRDSQLAESLLKLLVEWEVAAKNFPLPMAWLMSLFFLRWEQIKASGYHPMFDEKTLLLMYCARS